MARMDTDVLIVGAGPTGLMLANQLARRGISCMIVDRHSGPAQQTRAMAVHARTLEIYARLGIAEQALALGRRGNGANLWAQGKRTARIPLGDIGRNISPFPFVLMLGQDDNEKIMGEHLRALAVEVQWNTELIALDQKPDRVTARLRQADGSSREVTAAYVGGCDGGHSAVRKLCGIDFEGAAYEHVFFVADTEATGSMVADELNVYLWRDGFHLFFPMRGRDRWRVIGILPEKLRGSDDVKFDELRDDLRREAGVDLEFRSCSWFSTYRIHHRAARRFRDRRCFILGDAAHVHSPMGGQGMNTGLQDAYNLAWKLALVVAGRADAKLLDTYEAERIPVARRLLSTTDRAFMLIVSKGAFAALLRTRILARMAAFAMRFERVQRLAFRTISQTGITYRESPVGQTLPGVPADAPQAGDRFPWLHLKFEAGRPAEDLYQKLDDTRYTLLVIGQAAPAQTPSGCSGLMNTLMVPVDAHNAGALAAVHIVAPAFYLLRPDGHVGVAGTRFGLSSLDTYFAAGGVHSRAT